MPLIGGQWATKLLILSGILIMSLSSTTVAYAPHRSVNQTARADFSEIHPVVDMKYVSFELPRDVPLGYQVDETPQTISNYRTMLSAQLKKYSNRFFDNIGLKQIYVVGDIYQGKTKILGYASPNSGTLVLSAQEDRVSDPLVVSTIHHELAHIMLSKHEQRSGSFESVWPFAKSDRDASTSIFPAEGFVTRYGMTNWREDLADTFGFYQTPYYRDLIRQQSRQDSVIASKIQIIDEIYSSYQ